MPSCCTEARQTRSQIQKLVMSDFEAIDGKILKETVEHQPALLTHYPHLFFKKVFIFLICLNLFKSKYLTPVLDFKNHSC